MQWANCHPLNLPAQTVAPCIAWRTASESSRSFIASSGCGCAAPARFNSERELMKRRFSLPGGVAWPTALHSAYIRTIYIITVYEDSFIACFLVTCPWLSDADAKCPLRLRKEEPCFYEAGFGMKSYTSGKFLFAHSCHLRTVIP